MRLRHALPLAVVAALTAGCASSAISPTYTSANPDIMRISDERPADPEKRVEDLGSYCVEVSETWNAHGTTPDGKSLWAKDTARTVVPCD